MFIDKIGRRGNVAESTINRPSHVLSDEFCRNLNVIKSQWRVAPYNEFLTILSDLKCNYP